MVAEAARRALESLPIDVDEVSSRKLKSAVMALLPDGGANVSDQVFKAGLALLNKESTEQLARGFPAWVKPEPTSRTWIRGGAQHCPSNAPIPVEIQ